MLATHCWFFAIDRSGPTANKLRGMGKHQAGAQLSPEELEYVDTSAKGSRWWRCKRCSDEKASAAAAGVDRQIQDDISKRTAADHLKQVHGLSPADCKEWISMADQGMVKHQR